MEYISITAAAREKNVSRQSIYYAIATRKLDSEKVADRIVVVKNQKYEDYK